MDTLKGLRCRDCGRSRLHEVLLSDVTIRPSLSALNRALADRHTSPGAEDPPELNAIKGG